ncbi:hypothetical protein HPB50_026635 [Hyalomma asiaticum]|uniref:Uncharacterized protein n=1 Tax=Hyalomma asiaticum TaxID=266040 RepID=A0ACB7T2I0_HYAAI|nr:hypothetical protein HPB50_026635 [Hyalomma asiaticum]
MEAFAMTSFAVRRCWSSGFFRRSQRYRKPASEQRFLKRASRRPSLPSHPLSPLQMRRLSLCAVWSLPSLLALLLEAHHHRLRSDRVRRKFQQTTRSSSSLVASSASAASIMCSGTISVRGGPATLAYERRASSWPKRRETLYVERPEAERRFARSDDDVFSNTYLVWQVVLGKAGVCSQVRRAGS